jgi:hypothetical protein
VAIPAAPQPIFLDMRERGAIEVEDNLLAKLRAVAKGIQEQEQTYAVE